ncbi:hypothetical protein [Stenotrophomonas sp.]|uniref:hypothetical protein n=1 Tax=Stenotrophomonas sp. TaxID=69392 RepID=UPI002FCBECDB
MRVAGFSASATLPPSNARSTQSGNTYTSEAKKSQLLESTLELGRNWALAVAISSAGTAAFYTETVDGPVNWEERVFIGCILASLAWMFFAVLRFDEGLTRALQGKGKVHRFAGLMLYGVLTLAGTLLVLQVGKFADNNAIVKICDSKADSPTSKIYKADECVRLRAQRQAKIDRLEGN